jgi:hypothetical protein
MALNVITAHQQQQQQQGVGTSSSNSSNSSSSSGWSVDQLHLAIEACRWVTGDAVGVVDTISIVCIGKMQVLIQLTVDPTL